MPCSPHSPKKALELKGNVYLITTTTIFLFLAFNLALFFFPAFSKQNLLPDSSPICATGLCQEQRGGQWKRLWSTVLQE